MYMVLEYRKLYKRMFLYYQEDLRGGNPREIHIWLFCPVLFGAHLAYQLLYCRASFIFIRRAASSCYSSSHLVIINRVFIACSSR